MFSGLSELLGGKVGRQKKEVPLPQVPWAKRGLAEQMDLIHRDSPKFAGWMKKSGGYHWDDKLGEFVPD